MGSFIKNALFKFIVPVIIIWFMFGYGPLVGFASMLAYILILLVTGRIKIYSTLGTMNYYRGNTEAALKWLKKAYKTGKAKPEYIIQYAYILLRTGNLDESETLLNAVLARKLTLDEKMQAKSNLSLVLWKKGQLDDAIEMLEEVFEKYKNTTVYGSLGYLIILKGDLDKALEFNQEAYEYNNTNAIILDNLAQTYYLKGNYDKAEGLYEELQKLNPEFPAAFYNYALVLVKQNNYKKALECLQKANSFKLSFLSAVTKEEIDSKIEEVEHMLENVQE